MCGKKPAVHTASFTLQVQDLLAPLRNDPRMNFFMQDYDIMYQELVVSNRHRVALRIKVPFSDIVHPRGSSSRCDHWGRGSSSDY